MAKGQPRRRSAQAEIAAGFADEVAQRPGGPGLQIMGQPRPRPKSKAPTIEEKIANFQKLSHDRCSAVDEALYQLRQLCNQEQYKYTPEDVTAIIAFLMARVKAIETSFCVGKKITPFHVPSSAVADKYRAEAAAAKFGYRPPHDVDIEIAGISANVEFGTWPVSAEWPYSGNKPRGNNAWSPDDIEPGEGNDIDTGGC